MPINRTGTAGSDKFYATAAAEAFDGLGNYDFVYYTDSTSDLVINLRKPSDNRGDAAGDTFTSIEYFGLGQGNDKFTGSAIKEQIDGYLGDDVLNGGGGDDIISGHSGNDNISGGSGNDKAWGGGGDDRLNGGTGNDYLVGDKGNDRIIGGSGDDELFGGTGDDNISGGTGSDTLIGGQGADRLNVGSASDNVRDYVRYTAVSDFGDIITGFDSNGMFDMVQLGGALRTAYDDASADLSIAWGEGNGGAGTVDAIVGQGTGDLEALYLSGAAGEGVTRGQLKNAGAVANAFNTEFNITAANGEDAFLVVNDTNSNSFAVWHWVQAGEGEVGASELSLVGVFTSNATVSTASFEFI
ncbi:MAG: calcium-binding protein [Hyphomicrobiaceae bacterium]